MTPFRLGDRCEPVDEGAVAVEVLSLEPGGVVAIVVLGELPGGERRGDQAAREHAVGGDADAELAGGGQDVCLDAARHQ